MTQAFTTPKKITRDSNLELYRIVVMLLIVAHHFVVNSGLIDLIRDNGTSASGASMLIFGAWGKTGINCFVLITGYFMCQSAISSAKFIKLYLQIIFYGIILYAIFCFSGHITFSPFGLVRRLFPIYSVSDGFVSCFMIFYLLIPFINIMLHNLPRRSHLALAALLITVYSLFPMMRIYVSYNYVGWFTTLYIIASYIRFYNPAAQLNSRHWSFLTLALIVIGSVSVLTLYHLHSIGTVSSWNPYYFISDSNKPLALATALASFMWFKSIRLKYSPTINTISAATFGVLLIHANSDTMRQWLWHETVQPAMHLYASVLHSVGYATAAVTAIFFICVAIDLLRARFIEPAILPMFHTGIKRLGGIIAPQIR